MRRIQLALSSAEARGLDHLAAVNCRDPREHLRFLLREELHRQGLLNESDWQSEEPIAPSDTTTNWQIDCAQLDIAVKDNKTGHPRFPWIAVVFDELSGRIIGTRLSLKPPDGAEVAAMIDTLLANDEPSDKSENDFCEADE